MSFPVFKSEYEYQIEREVHKVIYFLALAYKWHFAQIFLCWMINVYGVTLWRDSQSIYSSNKTSANYLPSKTKEQNYHQCSKMHIPDKHHNTLPPESAVQNQLSIYNKVSGLIALSAGYLTKINSDTPCNNEENGME